MEQDSKIYIAGHRGMVGSAISRNLRDKGFGNILAKTSKELDLRDQKLVMALFAQEKPQYVFLAAARVGGILANNTYRAEFIYDNLQIETNIIHAAWKYGCKKLLFLGSSCIYPKHSPQPMKEEHLLTGALEPTNEPYAIAKIAGIKLCEAYRDQYGSNFISVMPTNLYGYGDNYDLQNSHVLPALIRKIHEARVRGDGSVEVWGSGRPKREFLFADDLADACVFLMEHYDDKGLVNIGTGSDISISDLATLIMKVAGYRGELKFDPSRPDGTPRKLLDVSKLHGLGWRHRVALDVGVGMVYEEFRKNIVTYI